MKYRSIFSKFNNKINSLISDAVEYEILIRTPTKKKCPKLNALMKMANQASTESRNLNRADLKIDLANIGKKSNIEPHRLLSEVPRYERMETILVKQKYSDSYVGFMTLWYGEHQKDYWETQPFNPRIILEQKLLWHRKMWGIPDSSKAHLREWCILSEIYVLPEHRSKGIGASLFSYFIQFCEINGLMKIVEGPISEEGAAMLEKTGLRKNSDWFEYWHNLFFPTQESLIRISLMTEQEIWNSNVMLIDWKMKS